MSQRNKYAFGAIGLVLGVGLALLFLVWSFPGFRNPAYQQDRYRNAKNSETGEVNPVTRPSIWETYTSPTDTYAQWIMAILSLVATSVSIWAVWLVRNTLEETRSATKAAEGAVEITRKMGRAQTRAYIHIDVIELREVNSEFGSYIWIGCRNFGQTPARCVNIKGRHNVGPNGMINVFCAFELEPEEVGRVLGPNCPIYSRLPIPTDHFENVRQLIETRKEPLEVCGAITYKDMFGKDCWTTFRYRFAVDDDTGLADHDQFHVMDEGNDCDHY